MARRIPHNKGKKGWTNNGSFKKGHKLNLGKKWKVPLDNRKNMGKGQKGVKSIKKGKTYEEMYGVVKAKIIKKKISKNRKGYPKSTNAYSYPKGNKHPNWKGGITSYAMELRNSEKDKIWRSKVFERDNWTCQTCGKRGCYLEAHHIIPFCKLIKTENEKLIFDIDNGVTLCKDCHNLTKLGGATK